MGNSNTQEKNAATEIQVYDKKTFPGEGHGVTFFEIKIKANMFSPYDGDIKVWL